MKTIAVIALSLLSLLVVSCSNQQRQYVIGVSQCSDDAWRRKMNGEILRETFMYGNVDVEFVSCNDNSRRQIEDIKRFINKGVDLIVVAPNEVDALTPIIERAYDRGIPVVVVDRKIESDKYTAYIGADNEEIGYSVGNYICRRNAGRDINLVELSGLANSSPAQERHKGLLRAIAEHPNIKLQCSVDAGWFRESAYRKMDSILAAGGHVDMVFAQNDMMALGAYAAAQKRHRNHDIEFIGIDAIAGDGLGLESVENKTLAASFEYPTGGDIVLQVCMDILEKRPYRKITTLKTAVVDSENVESIMLQTAQVSELDQKIETLNGKISNYISRYYTQKVVLFCCLFILLLIAVLLLVAVKALAVKNRLNRMLSEKKEQLEAQYEQMVRLSKRLEEATQAKLVFFTNISHDFRTPLTLVVDPVEQLLASPSISGNDRRLLLHIKKNTGILLRLVNQILDFRKYENGRMDYHPEPVDLRQSISAWNESFSSVAVKKHVHFIFNTDDCGSYVTECDKEKMESIYFNLLSNAFKYTPENGTVNVELRHVDYAGKPYLRFSVANTGSLISAEHVAHIFDRFYQADLHHSGSGIGLALAKAFVDMHGGKITVESSEKSGTSFVVEIPYVESPVPVIDSGVVRQEDKMVYVDIAEDAAGSMDEDSSKPLVLVIDDNDDIRSYIKSVLDNNYRVIDAPSGANGLRMAMKYVPDLIICDVMMPGIDGIECCRRLKSELQTCHIPVILLTACSLDEQRMQGYACGADSYISKPFNSDLLRTRVANLVASRRQLKGIFGDNSELVKEDISDIDKDFVARFRAFVDSNLSDSELGVDDIGKAMGMSRVQLYRKIKSLTNYSPNELLRIARLKKARSMMAASDISVSEAAYATGFSSPSYFTKCYKEYFGENPISLKQRKSGD